MSKKKNKESQEVEQSDVDIQITDDLTNEIETIQKEMKVFQELTAKADLSKSIELPVIAIRGDFVLPFKEQRILIGRLQSTHAVEWSYQNECPLLCIAQKDKFSEKIDSKELYSTGVLVNISGAIPNHSNSSENISIDLYVKAEDRMNINEVYYDEENDIFRANCSPFSKDTSFEDNQETKDVMISLWSDIANTIQHIHSLDSDYTSLLFLMDSIKDRLDFSPVIIYNYLAKEENTIALDQIQKIVEEPLVLNQMLLLNHYLKVLQKLSLLRDSLRDKASKKVEKQQREYFIQEEIKVLQDSITEGNPDVEALKKEMETKFPPKDILEIYNRDLDKLRRLPSQSPDYNVQINYLQTVSSLPWGIYSNDNLNLKRAKGKLDKDHYGLEEVKERILEHLAILKLNKGSKSPIICLYGPPGVGKTSLGRSVAEALNRKYQRISLGGIHDESEIRGHRRTYIGSMPGRIIKGLVKAQTSNPVFILDEVDKVSSNSYNGDPHSALLEVLDPEQNNRFHDNFIDLDFDLSKVLFIATANDLNTIPAPLLDRMEIINVSGYIAEEKYQIAKRHLLPKMLEANGMSDKDIKISKPVMMILIDQYTRESGVRSLEKQISKVVRKLGYQFALDNDKLKPTVTKEDLATYLGVPTYNRDMYQGNRYAGVVTGLAWTSVGGEILFIETSLSRGKGTLTLTGNLGDVMKESAVLALEYIKSHADALHIDSNLFNQWNIHLHVPEGAIPKDGPSAGITMATALVSAFTQCKVKAYLAMTGEITLRGKVIPVGGVREKILAARRSGIREIVLSKENQKDVEKIKTEYLTGLNFHYVTDVAEVIDYALTNSKVVNAIDLDTKITPTASKL